MSITVLRNTHSGALKYVNIARHLLDIRQFSGFEVVKGFRTQEEAVKYFSKMQPVRHVITK